MVDGYSELGESVGGLFALEVQLLVEGWAEQLTHVELVVQVFDLLVELEVADGAGDHWNCGHVDELENGTVVLLIESDVEDAVGAVGEVEAGHPDHEHKSSVGTHVQGQRAGVHLVLALRVSVDDLPFDRLETHAREQGDEDGYHDDRGQSSGCGGVLAVATVAEEG